MMKVIQNDLRQILISLFFLPLSDGESAGYSNFLQKLCPNLLVILPLHIHSGRFHVPTVKVFNAVLVGFMDQYRFLFALILLFIARRRFTVPFS